MLENGGWTGSQRYSVVEIRMNGEERQGDAVRTWLILYFRISRSLDHSKLHW